MYHCQGLIVHCKAQNERVNLCFIINISSYYKPPWGHWTQSYFSFLFSSYCTRSWWFFSPDRRCPVSREIPGIHAAHIRGAAFKTNEDDAGSGSRRADQGETRLAIGVVRHVLHYMAWWDSFSDSNGEIEWYVIVR